MLVESIMLILLDLLGRMGGEWMALDAGLTILGVTPTIFGFSFINPNPQSGGSIAASLSPHHQPPPPTDSPQDFWSRISCGSAGAAADASLMMLLPPRLFLPSCC